ncbi:tRNA (guanosine(18)-2'-O)-methyltransferase TrmH [Porticoccus sp.]|uniref:tRNA (guanosine(18)-2'-O)-methyltransferase TrmH n=1 Tax=Porticoccus sp. TaxID=2024853 RepID=UPI003F6A1E5C
MTPQRFEKIQQVLDRRQPDLTVITDQVNKGQNLSAIIRTCDAVGIHRVHAIYDAGNFRPHTGTAMGSQKWVKTEVHRKITTPVEQLQRQGFQVLAAHFEEGAMDYRDVDYTRPTALLLGAEKRGVSAQALDRVDGCVVVPMMGMSESFNVSVACAIILAEAQRQRQVAGLYRQRHLPDEEYRQLLFEWCQPVIARFCRVRGLAYPELDDTGHMRDPQQFSSLTRCS